MANFRIGQRVRKVAGMCLGNTGVVVEFDHTEGRCMGVRVDADGEGIDWLGNPVPFCAGEVMRGDPDEFEPILPEGMQPVPWSECLWQPEGEKVS